MTGSAGQKRVPRTFIESNPFPLPPINEQKRIVSKVDQLMNLCNELETLLKNTEHKAERFVKAVINRI
jgi:type I restriction enzyme S subunit